MTRDEAIGRWFDVMRKSAKARELEDAVAAEVDGFVALGLLKLDEPKTAEDKLWDELASVSRFDRSDSMLKRAIDRAGLKIVEK